MPSSSSSSTARYSILMVSDFFFPNLGGVEMHIWSLSQCLIQRGHKVVVLTHAYGDRQGIRYMTNGLKVYYLPLTVCYDQIIFPTLFAFFPLFRNILIREQVQIVHGHQSTSTLANECMLYARTLGYKICYTDHSLFGFADVASIHINKILKSTLSDIDCAICVSNTCRENLVVRASLHPSQVYTIPNAVDASKFTPDPSKRFPTHTVNIVLVSRLVYRKGIDLLVKVIPLICARFPHVYFIIGGDGPKKLYLEEMRERFQLHERVEFLGILIATYQPTCRRLSNLCVFYRRCRAPPPGQGCASARAYLPQLLSHRVLLYGAARGCFVWALCCLYQSR